MGAVMGLAPRGCTAPRDWVAQAGCLPPLPPLRLCVLRGASLDWVEHGRGAGCGASLVHGCLGRVAAVVWRLAAAVAKRCSGASAVVLAVSVAAAWTAGGAGTALAAGQEIGAGLAFVAMLLAVVALLAA